MNKIPLLDLKKQYESLSSELLRAFEEVMISGNYILGPEVSRLEQKISQSYKVKHAIGVANGTDALLLTLDALGIGPGDEVITTPFTFFATSEVISQLGATPVFVDIEPETYNIDASKIESVISDKTKAIIPVHIFGQPCDMEEIMKIASKHNLHVIEDACQAIGSTYNDKFIGSLGTAGCFSFFPTKNLGGYGDGGMIVTNDDELAKKIRILRAHGSSPKYYHSMIGYNSRLDTLQAALLCVKLPFLEKWNKQRNEKAKIYNEAFENLPIQLPIVKPNRYSVYHLYIIQTKFRNDLLQYLQEHGIASGVYYPVPLHLQEVYSGLNYQVGSLPIAEGSCEKTLALPLYPELSLADQEFVIQTVKNFFEKR